MMGGMNLDRIIAPQIQSIVPKLNIELHLFDGQTVDDAGVITSSYTIVTGIRAQVQFTKIGIIASKVRQELQLNNFIGTTAILKDFYIQSTSLTGLNRNLSTAGDYIKLDGLFYRIVAFPENFRTGWVYVVGAEGGSTIEST